MALIGTDLAAGKTADAFNVAVSTRAVIVPHTDADGRLYQLTFVVDGRIQAGVEWNEGEEEWVQVHYA